MDLREDKHWSYGVNGGFRRAEYQTPYVLSAPVQADRTGDSIKALQGDIKAFLTTKGITPAEFDRTITDVWFSTEEAAQAAGFTKATR